MLPMEWPFFSTRIPEEPAPFLCRSQPARNEAISQFRFSSGKRACVPGRQWCKQCNLSSSAISSLQQNRSQWRRESIEPVDLYNILGFLQSLEPDPWVRGSLQFARWLGARRFYKALPYSERGTVL